MKDETDPGPINDTQMTPMDEITERPEFKDDIKMDQDLDMKVTIEGASLDGIPQDGPSQQPKSTEHGALGAANNPKPQDEAI